MNTKDTQFDSIAAGGMVRDLLSRNTRGTRQDTYIKDVLYFLGKSVDSDKYCFKGGFDEFVAEVLGPIVDRARETRLDNAMYELGN